MAGRDAAIERAERRTRRFVSDLGGELRLARLGAGLSQGSVGRRAAMSASKVGRIERGRAARVALGDLGRLASVVGLELAVRLFPGARPARDAPHLALLERLRARLHASLSWRIEVPIPLPGDRRAWDAVIDGLGVHLAVEAETRIVDVQALVRRIELKRRDSGVEWVLIVAADTRHNRAVLRAADVALRDAFPVPARAMLRALADGRPPGGGSIVLL